MSSVRSRDIAISGDGVAIGDNNRLTVVKNERHHHHHQRPTGSTSSGGRSDRPGEVLMGLGMLAMMACVLGTYVFAKNADLVYTLLHGILFVEMASAAYVLYADYHDGYIDYKVVTQYVVATLASGVLLFVHIDYRDELTALARSTASATEFWCSMQDVDRQFEVLHALTAAFGFGLGGLLLAGPTMAMLAWRFSDIGSTGWSLRLFERLSSWPMVIFGTVMMSGAVFFHTDFGWDTWTGVFSKPPTFFCNGAQAFQAPLQRH